MNAVDIISSSIAHTGVNNTTATAIASAITSTTSSPNYTATASNNVVTLTAVTRGTGQNGLAVVAEQEGDFDINCGGTISALSGGIDNAVTDITVNGVQS